MSDEEKAAVKIEAVARGNKDRKRVEKLKTEKAKETEKKGGTGDAAKKDGDKAMTDEEKAAARAEWFETDLPDWLRRIEAVVMETSSTPGYCVGSSPSYADVVIWALLRDCAADDLGETIKSAASCELLNSIADEIAANPNVKRWLESRPETKF